MAQLKETKIYGGLDVYDSFENKNNILSVNSTQLSIYKTAVFNNGANISIGDTTSFLINDSTLSSGDDTLFKITKSEIVFNSFANIKDSNDKKLSAYINETVKDKGIYASLETGATFNFYLLGTAEKNSTYGIPVKLSSVYIAGDGQLNAGSFKGKNFYATSDERLKENIKLSNLDFMNILNKFKVKEYNFKDDVNKQKNVGIIAQDLLKIIPEDLQKFYLTQDSKGFYSVNDSKLVYILIGALQQEHKKNLELESRLNKLERLFNER